MYNDETKDVLLWKLREYNRSTEYLIDNLYKLEMMFRIDVNHQSIKKLIRFLGLLFVSNIHDNEKLYGDYSDKFTDYANSVLTYSRIPEGKYEYFKKFKKLVTIVKNIHNVLEGDKNQYYQFICQHLKNYLKPCDL